MGGEAVEVETQIWDRVKATFEEAVVLEGAEREAYLRRACRGEPELRSCVSSLLAADESGSRWLRRGLAGPVREAMASPPGESAGPGRRLGPYRLVKELGRGGMGTVYLAERDDGEYRQRVALKVVSTGRWSGEMQARFLAERQILARLEHPNVARLLDGGTTRDGLPYLVMEHVEGKEIRRYCREHGSSAEARLDLVLQICEAVEVAHRSLVVHRDLKPANLLVTGEGQVKLLDFGIAKLLQPEAWQLEAGEGLTRAGSGPLTPGYASPEQILGGPVTTQSDVYSLGVLLYELLTGRRPHDRRGPAGRLPERVLREGLPPAPSRLLRALGRGGSAEGGREPGVRSDLDAIVLKALDPEPERRYGSAAALAADLRRFLRHEPVEAVPPRTGYRLRKLLRRHRSAAVASALVVLSLLGGLVARSLEAQRANRAAELAQREQQAAQEVSDFLVSMLESADPKGMGREVKVVDILDPAAEGLPRRFGERPEVRATLHLALARTYDSLSLRPEAEAQYRAALDLNRKHRGLTDRRTVFNTLRLGGLLNRTGRHEEASALVEPFWRRLREQLGSTDLRTLDAQMAWGHSLDWLGRTDESIALIQAVAEALENHHPEEVELLLHTHHDLGLVFSNGRRLEEAEAQARRTLALARHRLGEDSPLTLRARSMVGRTLTDLGRHKEAQIQHRKVIEILEEAGPERDHERASWLLNLGVSLELDGKVAEAEAVYRESLELAERLAGPHSRLALLVRINLLDALQLQGRLEEALSLSREHGEVMESVFGTSSIQALMDQLRRGDLLIRTGELGEGERILRTLEPRIGVNASKAVVAVHRAVLGLLRLRQGRLREAEPLLVTGYRDLLAMQGVVGSRSRFVRSSLIELYEATGRTEAAARLASDPMALPPG